ncbi:MAG: hypothetical protein DRJ42_25160 [Deltaproteobacteria bacterium]|nr:MAG: hypothetical protein DRJ42_25160 [Deltaproteobacteria bacterium]
MRDESAGEGDFDRLRLRQAIRVIDIGSGETLLKSTPDDLVEFVSVIQSECYAPEQLGSTYCPGTVGGCSESHCQAYAHLCAAQLLMEIAGVVSEPMELAEYTVPPQNIAARALLKELAMEEARQAVFKASAELRFAGGLSGAGGVCTLADLDGSVGDETMGRSFAMLFVEAHDVAKEAGLSAAGDALSLADLAFSELPTSRGAAELAFSAPLQSRASAVHLLIGGEDGLYDELINTASETTALCTAPPLSAGAKAALGVLRESGFDPRELIKDETTLSTGAVLTGTGIDSVRERLSEFWFGTTVVSETDWKDDTELAFAGRFGLTLDDFREAREYYRQESRAFGRSLSQLAPARVLAGGGSTTIPRFAAMIRPPSPPPSEFYATLGRYDGAPPNDWTYKPTLSYAGRGLAHLLDYIATESTDLLLNGTWGTAADDVERPLAAFVADAARERPARLTQWWSHDVDNPEWSHGYADLLYDSTKWQSNDLRMVTTTAGLSCAVNGHIEGEACNWTEAAALPPDGTFGAATNTGFDQVAYWDLTTSITRFYLLRVKDGRAPDAPGSYEQVIGGWNVQGESDYGTLTPVVPELSELAAEYLTPSTSWCTHARETCAGTSFDERIPLENELIDDGDAVESSWRHYLQLARQAANEADMLGERVIADGLEMDRRAETALEELEGICGTTIDVDSLMAEDGSDAVGATGCPGTACADGQQCLFGRCVLDALEVAKDDTTGDPNLQRLENCLGDDATKDFVALGDAELCVLRDGVELCPGIEPCPRRPDEGGGCTSYPATGTQEWVLVDETLGYFAADEATTGVGGVPPCDAVRMLRGATTATGSVIHDGVLRIVKDSGFFEPNSIRMIARSIGWEAHPYDTSTVTLSGRPWITTGDMYRDPATLSEWPCGAPDASLYCGAGAPPWNVARDGLFCSSVAASPSACADREERALFNDRLARAVITARMMTSTGFSGIHAAFAPYDADDWGGGGQIDLSEVITPNGLVRVGHTWDFKEESIEHTTYCDVAGGPVWTQVFGDASIPEEFSCITIYNKDRSASWIDNLIHGDDGTMFAHAVWSGMGATPPRRLSGGAGAGQALFRSVDGRGIGIGPWVADTLSDDRRYGVSQSYIPGSVVNSNAFIPWRAWHQRVETDTPGREVGGQDRNNDASIGCSGSGDLGDCAGAGGVGSLLDAVELICEAGKQNHGQVCASEPPRLNGVDDLPRLRDYFECTANSIEANAARTVFANFPQRAVDALREQSVGGAYPSIGGEYGVSVSVLRASLVELAEVSQLLGAEVRHLANDIDALRLAIQSTEIQADISDLRFMQTVSAQLTECVVAGSSTAPGAGFATAAKCANAIAQIAFADQIRGLETEAGGVESELATVNFRDRFTSRTTALQGYATRINAALERIDAQLANIESQQSRGRRLLAKAAFLDTDEMAGTHYNVNTVMRRRYNTGRVRYERAKENAIRMAYLAKRAVEQRLGMRLGTLRDDMTLVAAPSTWEAELCTLEGLDYSRIRDSTALTVDNFANGYIGDYVTKLELVVESYRLDYPFQNGRDTAVVSLRDDVMGARAVCDAPVGNLLYHAGQFTAPASAEGAEGWARVGCTGDLGVLRPNCAIAQPLDEGLRAETNPFDSASTFVPLTDPLLSSARGHRVTFGDLEEVTGCNAGTPDCGLTDDTELGQMVALEAGRYRISWYAAPVGTEGPLPDAAVDVRNDADGTSLIAGAVSAPEMAEGAWQRRWAYFDLDDGVEVRVSIVPKPPASGDIVPQQVDIAALMLEDVTGVVTDSVVDTDATPPKLFANTGATLTRPQPVCEDTTGDVFRSDWRYRCQRLCGEGFGRGCEDRVGANYCYWESQFVLTQRDIERGGAIRNGGFARGNYNYRADTVALNFVGTALRDCSDSDYPSSCYAAGYVPYSIEHIGPYTVRNHRGEDYDAPLYTGRIEHARGLAAERYLTNPLSSADRSLVEPYLHRELRGRPLDGTYVIRVWDEPGVDFNAIEDVQVLLNYIYWTRTD